MGHLIPAGTGFSAHHHFGVTMEPADPEVVQTQAAPEKEGGEQKQEPAVKSEED